MALDSIKVNNQQVIGIDNNLIKNSNNLLRTGIAYNSYGFPTIKVLNNINGSINFREDLHFIVYAQSCIFIYPNRGKLGPDEDVDLDLSSYSGKYVVISIDNNVQFHVNEYNFYTFALPENHYYICAFLVSNHYKLLDSAVNMRFLDKQLNIDLMTDTKPGLIDNTILSTKINSVLSDYQNCPITNYNNLSITNINGTYHLIAPPTSIFFKHSNGVVLNKECDIELLHSYNEIRIDTSGYIHTYAYNSSESREGYLIACVFPDVDLYWSIVEFNVNGRPLGLPIASANNAGLLSTELYNKLLEYDYLTNQPILPNNIFITDEISCPLYKYSMFLNPQYNLCDLTFTTKTEDNKYTAIDIQEPSYINYNDAGQNGKITLIQTKYKELNIFKNVTIYKSTIASKLNTSSNILMIGDSITHGNAGTNSSPVTYLKNKFQLMGFNTTMVGTFAPYGINQEGRGCFNFEAMAGVDNNPYAGNYHFPSVGDELLIEYSDSKRNRQMQNPFTFSATSDDLQNRPEMCFTNSNNYSNEEDGICYADATSEQKQNYHFFIFDFEKYLSLLGPNNVPNIITIALGVNDWNPVGRFDIDKTFKAIDIVYAQIRRVLPTVKLAFMSSQCPPYSFQNSNYGNFVEEIAPFILRMQIRIDLWRSNGDTNVYEIPMYANCSRWFSWQTYDQAPSYINQNNNVQLYHVSGTDPHCLDRIGQEGYMEYMNTMFNCIVCLM